MRGTIREAIAVLTPVLTALANAVVDASAGAEFRRALGVLKSDLSNQVESGDVVASLSSLFDLAVRAGTTIDRMERVRVAAQAQTPFYLMGRVLMAMSVRLALITETRVISQTVFSSRTDVEALLAQLNAAFGAAEEDASENREAAVYRALVNLHAATVRDLLARSRPLPRMTTYQLARPTSSIRLAQRLYYNAARAEELWRENRKQTPHPLFMRPEGRALSA